MVTYLGSLVQFFCGEGGTLQTSITGVCGECSHCLGHTEFVPIHSMCAFLVYTAQVPGCSAEELSKAGPGFCALPRSKPLSSGLGYCTGAQTCLGLCFVPFPGLSSSGDQVFCELTLPGWGVHLTTSLVPATLFPGCAAGAPSRVCCLSPLGS